jgi:hypothetical protein
MKTLFLCICIILSPVICSAEDIYISQTAQGADSGTNCSNSHSSSWFNTSTNWANPKVSGKIGPGDTAHLCGPIATSLAIAKSGSSGSPITILFETGAKLSQPAATSFLTSGGNSYLIIDGGTNGIVENTDNGSPQGGYTYQISYRAFDISNSSNIEITNLTFRTLYVHTDPLDPAAFANSPQVIYCNGPGSNISIHDNSFSDTTFTISLLNAIAGSSGMYIYNNSFNNYDHGVALGNNTNGYTNINIYNNHFGSTANWDTAFNYGCTGNGVPWSCCTGVRTGNCPLTTTSNWHHDGIHVYLSTPYDSNAVYGISIYNNLFDGDWGIDNTAHVFLEDRASLGSSGGIRNPKVFNNVFNHSGNTYRLNNGALTSGRHGSEIYNNTFIGMGSGDICFILDDLGGGIQFINNVLTSCGGFIYNETTTSPINSVINYNVYANGYGSNLWWYNHLATSSFSTWQGETGGDANSQFITSAGLDSIGHPETSSPVIGAGTNVYSLGITALDSDKSGISRPIGANWDIGAYQFIGGKMPPPINLGTK